MWYIYDPNCKHCLKGFVLDFYVDREGYRLPVKTLCGCAKPLTSKNMFNSESIWWDE